MESQIPSFSSLGVTTPFADHLASIGFKVPTEIQQSAIPELLTQTRDFIGMASTGTGKTGAFAIPLIENIIEGKKRPQALVLCPTRELAQQVAGQIESMGQFRRVKVALIYGGSSYQTQIRSLKNGASIVVATPGRLLDLLEQGLLQLNEIRTLILDEADEMLSLGFQEALNTLLKKMKEQRNEDEERRIWLFSATMSPSIQRISERYLKDPVIVKKTAGSKVTEDIEQSYILVHSQDKLEVLKRVLLKHNDFYGLIFCQTRGETEDLAGVLRKSGQRVEALHGDKSQAEREKILDGFRKRNTQIVVATDVAARGIDVKDLTHVVNWSMPWDVETYIHRIGRTGRNGQKGIALSLVSPSQMQAIRRIEKVTRQDMIAQIPPSVEDIQNSLLASFYGKLEKTMTNERLSERLKKYSEGLEIPEWLRDMDMQTLVTLFVSIHTPEFFRQNSLQDPQKERRSSSRSGGGGRGGYAGGGRRGGGYGGGGDRGGDGAPRKARFRRH